MRSILVVANQTLGGETLMRRMREVVYYEPCRFHVVVPATPVHHQIAWSEGEAHVVARHRLAAALAALDREGFIVTGEVADPSPMLAISDAMRVDHYDEVILSTLPLGVSRWVHLDLPARVRRRFGVPVTQVISDVEVATT
jgi:hypothetical protein